MSIEDQIIFMHAALAAWATGNKGRVEIAADSVDMIDLLAASPGAPRAVIVVESELPWGDYPELGKVERTYVVAVSRGKGFNLERGDSLVKGAGGGKPMFTLVGEAREIVRGLRFNDHTVDQRPNYKGFTRLELNGVIVDAFVIRIGVICQNPELPREVEVE